jgi:hypothetical protein
VRPGVAPAASLAGPFGLTLAALLGCAYLAVVDPNNPSAPMPVCPTKVVTGWDCPACGGLRMTRALLHGDVAAAARANLLLLVLAPLAVVWLGTWWRRTLRAGPAPAPSVPWTLAGPLLVVAVAWTVVRNL